MELRPLTVDDVAEASALAAASIATVWREAPPYEGERRAFSEARMAHCLRHDPDGAWVAEDESGLAGVALATVRDRSWFLSLLSVRVGRHGAGLGRRLLDAALRTSVGCVRAGIASSSHPGALRRYARAGFALHPSFEAAGPLGPSGELARGVREVGLADGRVLFDDVDRAVRRATRGPDRDLLELASGRRWLLVDDAGGTGYAAVRPTAVDCLAATTEDAARRLLASALATLASREGGDARAMGITASEQWAVDVALDAGLALRSGVTVCRRGDADPFGPYLLSPVFG